MPTLSFAGFPKEMTQFFRALQRNNRREWFQPRKDRFEQHVKAPLLELIAAVNAQLAKFAPEYVTDPAKAMFRIYRDTRFSADKTPYKTHAAAWFRRRGPKEVHMAGFYFSVSASEIEIAGGLYHPPRETMLLVRTHLSEHYPELCKILAGPKLHRLMGHLQGDELTRAPKGFDPKHPAAGLIKKKDWILDAKLDPKLSTTPQLLREIADRFHVMTPFLEYLNRPLLVHKKPRDLSSDRW